MAIDVGLLRYMLKLTGKVKILDIQGKVVAVIRYKKK